MNYQDFEKTAKLPWGKIGIGAGIVGTGVGGALIGHAVGKNKGSKQMVEKFKEYNSKENPAIAQRAFAMGKEASLDNIASAAMEDEIMKIAAINPKVAKGLAIAGGALAAGGVGGAIGHAIGKKKGGEETRQKLTDYNKAENMAIAEKAYNMGKQAEDIAAIAAQEELSQYGFDLNMDKEAFLNRHYESCFEEELQKIAAPSLKNIGKATKESFGSMKNVANLLTQGKANKANNVERYMNHFGVGKDEATKFGKDFFKSELKKSLPALGITGATGLAGLGTIGAIKKGINSKKNREAMND